jgi:beta-lactamase regulating signal transducer with metallopeptidase domain/HEAT repeat protein
MTSILSQFPLPVLLFLAKATLLLTLALVGAAALRRASAGSRHMLWIGALAAVVLLPALSRWTPWHVEVLPLSLGESVGVLIEQRASAADVRRPSEISSAAAVGTATRDDRVAPTGAGEAGATSGLQSRSEEPDPSLAHGAAAVADPAAQRASAQRDAAPAAGAALDLRTALAALWMVGTLLLLARLVAGIASVSRIVRGARPLEGSAWTTPLWEVADRLGISRAPRLLRSDRVSMPFACGLFRPAIVLPADASGWDDARRRAVLFHELAHVRRRDLVGHTLARVACALYWFHPLVWAAARRLRSESERACDDLVLISGTRASDYAHHLLEIVTGVRNASAPAAALAMARRKEFEGRMLAILDPDQRRAAPGRLQATALLAGLVALTLTVSGMAPASVLRSVRVEDATRSTRDSAAAPAEVATTLDTFADTMATNDGRHLVATAPDTGTDERPGSGRRGTRTTIERSIELAAEQAASEIASARYGGAMRDWNDIAPRISAHSVDEVSRAVRASMRATFGVGMRDDAVATPADSGTTDLLVKLLQSDSDAKVRRTAAWALAQREERAGGVVTAALAATLTNDKSADVREMAAWGLGESEGRSATQALRGALQSDADERVKTTAAWALGSIRDSGSAAALGAAMGDSSARVRSRAAWALGQIEPDEAPGGLVAALGDSSDKVRLTAAWALGQIEDPATLSALSKAITTEKDHEIRDAELRALILLGEASDSTLQKLLESPDPDVRLKVTHAIIGFRGVRPWPWPMPMPRPMP